MRGTANWTSMQPSGLSLARSSKSDMGYGWQQIHALGSFVIIFVHVSETDFGKILAVLICRKHVVSPQITILSTLCHGVAEATVPSLYFPAKSLFVLAGLRFAVSSLRGHFIASGFNSNGLG